MEEIQTKVTSTAFLQTHAISYSSTVQLLYIVKEKGVKPDRKSYPLPNVARNPYRNLNSENSQDCTQKPQQNCTFMNSASGERVGLSPLSPLTRLFLWFAPMRPMKHCSCFMSVGGGRSWAGSFRRTLSHLSPLSRCGHTGPPVYIGWNRAHFV